MLERVVLLTEREKECLRLVLRGKGETEIANLFDVSTSTVSTLLGRCHRKLQTEQYGIGVRGLLVGFMVAHQERSKEMLRKFRELTTPERIGLAKCDEYQWNRWLFERDSLHKLSERIVQEETVTV